MLDVATAFMIIVSFIGGVASHWIYVKLYKDEDESDTRAPRR
jgi:hypothetical protein